MSVRSRLYLNVARLAGSAGAVAVLAMVAWDTPTAGAATGMTMYGDSEGLSTTGPPTILQVLDEDSQYVTGCFPAPPFACAGPLVLYPKFGGTFGLTAAGTDPDGFAVFEVSGLDLVASGGSTVIEVAGSGVYRRSSGKNAQQEMVLDLSINGGPITVFDSGIVPVPAEGSAIQISVDMNDLINYDTLITISANPGGVLSDGGMMDLLRQGPMWLPFLPE